MTMKSESQPGHEGGGLQTPKNWVSVRAISFQVFKTEPRLKGTVPITIFLKRFVISPSSNQHNEM